MQKIHGKPLFLWAGAWDSGVSVPQQPNASTWDHLHWGSLGSAVGQRPQQGAMKDCSPWGWGKGLVRPGWDGEPTSSHAYKRNNKACDFLRNFTFQVLLLTSLHFFIPPEALHYSPAAAQYTLLLNYISLTWVTSTVARLVKTYSICLPALKSLLKWIVNGYFIVCCLK